MRRKNKHTGERDRRRDKLRGGEGKEKTSSAWRVKKDAQSHFLFWWILCEIRSKVKISSGCLSICTKNKLAAGHGLEDLRGTFCLWGGKGGWVGMWDIPPLWIRLRSERSGRLLRIANEKVRTHLFDLLCVVLGYICCWCLLLWYLLGCCLSTKILYIFILLGVFFLSFLRW